MMCDPCAFVHKKITPIPFFNSVSGNTTGAIATTSRNRTKQLRVLAEAQNTKVHYKGGIASINPYISSINCNPDFSIINYTIPTNCSSRLAGCSINGGTFTKCYTNSVLIGGNPNSTPFYYINGGDPSAVALCYINGGRL